MKILEQSLQNRYWMYFVFAARFLLACTFIRYGYSKLIGQQFGISAEEMAMPLKDVSFFRLMWYLFDQQPLKYVVGILQIITGLLLLYNKTVIIGVMFFIPIAANILLMDITFMPTSLATGFTRRFIWYFFLCTVILWAYRNQIKEMWLAIVVNITPKLHFPIWWLIGIPIFSFILEFFPAIFLMLYQCITEPESVDKTFEYFVDVFNKLFN